MCDACRRQLADKGVVGACGHPYPGRPLEVRWALVHHAADHCEIAVVTTATMTEAMEALGRESHQIHDLSTPDLLREAERHPPGEVWTALRDRMPHSREGMADNWSYTAPWTPPEPESELFD